MKYILLLLTVCCLSASAQSKDDTKIIVTAADSTNLYNRVVKLLYASGYSVAQKDESNGFVLTDEKAITGAYSIKLKVMVEGSRATIEGLCALDVVINGLNRQFEQVKYKKLKSHIFNGAWKQMDILAKQIGGTITYSK